MAHAITLLLDEASDAEVRALRRPPALVEVETGATTDLARFA